MEECVEDCIEISNGSVTEWVLGVDIGGMVFIVAAPNISSGFFENGVTAEEVGFSPDVVEDEIAMHLPGLYKCQVELDVQGDHYDVDVYFNITKAEKIWPL